MSPISWPWRNRAASRRPAHPRRSSCRTRGEQFIPLGEGHHPGTFYRGGCSVRSIMQKYLEKTGEIKFEKIFNQRLGFLLLKDFAENICETACPQIKFYEAVGQWGDGTKSVPDHRL